MRSCISRSVRAARSWSRRWARNCSTGWNDGFRPRGWCAATRRQSTAAIDAAFADAILRRPEEWNAADRDALGYSEQVIGELEAADVVVIATPMNNYSVPATLKTWIDHVVRIRRTFVGTPQGKVGLLRDRPTYIVTAAGVTTPARRRCSPIS